MVTARALYMQSGIEKEIKYRKGGTWGPTVRHSSKAHKWRALVSCIIYEQRQPERIWRRR